MKKLFLLGLVFCLVIASNAQFTSAGLRANGLTCAMCSNAINKALLKLPFIQTVKPDIKNSTFQITFKEGQDINPDAIKDAVEDAGFSVGRLELSGDLSGDSVANDKHIRIGGSVYHFLDVGEQVINANTKIVVVDKDFLSLKQYKKISSASSMSCVKTGRAGTCCTDAGVAENARVYHVTI
ncbi:MAG: heavy metal-associated domain-containing protein [Chitinophagaceae bacterium]